MYCVGCKIVCNWMHSVTITPTTLSHSFRFWILFVIYFPQPFWFVLFIRVFERVWTENDFVLAICLQSTNYAPSLTIYTKWTPFAWQKTTHRSAWDAGSGKRIKDYSRGLRMFFFFVFYLVWLKLGKYDIDDLKPKNQQQQHKSTREKFFHQRKLGKVPFFPHYLIQKLHRHGRIEKVKKMWTYPPKLRWTEIMNSVREQMI